MQSVHPWPYARVSAHRGAGTMAPENTLEGFRAGLHHGFHAFETDAMLAAAEKALTRERAIEQQLHVSGPRAARLDAGELQGLAERYAGLPQASSRPSAGAAPTASGSTSRSSPPRAPSSRRAASSAA